MVLLMDHTKLITNTPDTEQLGLDEVEIDFLFNSGAVSRAVHVDTDGGD